MAAEDFKEYIQHWTSNVKNQMKGIDPTDDELDASDKIWQKMSSEERDLLHEFTKAIVDWNKLHNKGSQS